MRSGNAPVLLIADWLSQTWFRFNLFMVWLALVGFLAISPLPMLGKLAIFAISPVAAIIGYYTLFVMIAVVAFMPGLKVPVGYLRLIYFRLFSRIVVQEIELELPTWH